MLTEFPANAVAQRLRPAHSPERLAEIYRQTHDHRLYGRGHGERVQGMIDLGRRDTSWSSVADLSCGNGEVARALHVSGRRILGDIGANALSLGYDFCGPIEETIEQIDSVELFISGETLEHLDDPMLILCRARDKATSLLLSTPIDNWNDSNEQHYWAWSREAVDRMLQETGWRIPMQYREVDSIAYGEAYKYGIWLIN